jgi:putative ABC transport system permease protein
MIGLALKMLFGDTAKYLMLVFGIFFATFLILQQLAIFCGLMLWTTSTLKNVNAPIYVVDPQVSQVNETTPMRDTDVARVRSVSNVRWAMPLFNGIQRVKLDNGAFKIIQLTGIDSASLAGAPATLVAGKLEDLRLPNTVIIDELAVNFLSSDPDKPIKVGDRFEINDIEARVVGIAESMRSFTGGPYVWTTYERALQYAPPQRKMLSAVIAAPMPGVTLEAAAAEIEKQTGLRAYVNRDFSFDAPDDFNTKTVFWFVKNTSIPISFGTTVIVGLIVGIAISCQTFYAFVLDNLKHLGALKAMGMSNFRLSMMLVIQSVTVGIIGFGIGLLATAGFTFSAIENGAPFFMPTIIPFAVFAAIQLICLFAASLGIIRLSLYEPAAVFRT